MSIPAQLSKVLSELASTALVSKWVTHLCHWRQNEKKSVTTDCQAWIKWNVIHNLLQNIYIVACVSSYVTTISCTTADAFLCQKGNAQNPKEQENGRHWYTWSCFYYTISHFQEAETDPNWASVILLDSYGAPHFDRGAMICDVLWSEGGKAQGGKKNQRLD